MWGDGNRGRWRRASCCGWPRGGELTASSLSASSVTRTGRVETASREVTASSLSASSFTRTGGFRSKRKAASCERRAASHFRKGRALTAVPRAPTPLSPFRPKLLLAADCTSCSCCQLASKTQPWASRSSWLGAGSSPLTAGVDLGAGSEPAQIAAGWSVGTSSVHATTCCAVVTGSDIRRHPRDSTAVGCALDFPCRIGSLSHLRGPASSRGRCVPRVAASRCSRFHALQRTRVGDFSGRRPVGAVAQLGERCLRKAEVRGSIPLSSMRDVDGTERELVTLTNR